MHIIKIRIARNSLNIVLNLAHGCEDSVVCNLLGQVTWKSHWPIVSTLLMLSCNYTKTPNLAILKVALGACSQTRCTRHRHRYCDAAAKKIFQCEFVNTLNPLSSGLCWYVRLLTALWYTIDITSINATILVYCNTAIYIVLWHEAL